MKTMKSWMFAAILLCGTSMSAQAQEYYQTKDEVAVTIGGGTNSQLFDAFSRLFGVMGEALVTGIMTGGHYVGTTTYDNEKYSPALSVEYFHHVSPMVSIGGIAAFNGYSSDMFCNWQTSDNVSTKEKIGSAKKYNITVMPAMKFDWVRKKNFGIYSKIGLGATYMYEKEVQKNDGSGQDIDDKVVHSDGKWMANYQASLLGIEAGTEKIRGFAELGAGEQGIILAGLRYKF